MNVCLPGVKTYSASPLKNAFQWELQPRGISLQYTHQKAAEVFAAEIRKSQRVKDQVKEMDNLEICEHYILVSNDKLTNLGVLWLGTAAERLRLAYPITVQYIVYDENDNKVRKEEWHDCAFNPKELIIDIEKQAVELTYFHEFPYGLFRKQIRHYDPRTIRELLVNAIAHKSYTISADIMIQVYPDRLEIENPGGLPLGITKENILHKSHRRNPHLIRVLHDFGLMEGEGTGYNLLYEISSRDAKPFPELISSFDRMLVIQSSKILDEETVLLLDFVSQHYALTQKEFIVTGLVARHKKILSTQLAKELQLAGEERLRGFIGKLIDLGIVISRGIKKGTEYLINPKLIDDAKINVKPTLKVIEPHRLEALIEEDLRIYPQSSLEKIMTRLEDVPKQDIQKMLYRMVKKGVLEHSPDKTYRQYWLVKKNRS
jgi:ATP-dependent DNA helicase RecG